MEATSSKEVGQRISELFLKGESFDLSSSMELSLIAGVRLAKLTISSRMMIKCSLWRERKTKIRDQRVSIYAKVLTSRIELTTDERTDLTEQARWNCSATLP